MVPLQQVQIVPYICLTINLVSTYMENNISLRFLKRIIEENIEVANREMVTHIKYRFHISSGNGRICYRSFKLCNDCDVHMMFSYYQRFPEIQVLELYVELGATTFAGGSSQ